MNYPLWEVPFLGGAGVIGIIASIHVFLSHFAVGGGIFFALTERWAFNSGDNRIYDYLKKHSLFFLIVTTVFGVVTGVGIWWAISLCSPNGTHTLIQTYTLAWAIEYLFFVTEIATFFVYFYSWDKIPRKTHLRLADAYAILSIFTLLVINGILTFMLTPGGWLTSRNWVDGFFNAAYVPATGMRLIGMLALAGLYALVTASRLRDEAFRVRMLRYAAKWFLPIFFLGPLLAIWIALILPQAPLDIIQNGLSTAASGTFSLMARAMVLSVFLSAALLLMVFVGPYLNARYFSPRAAAALMVVGLLTVGMMEWTREMMRKPYVVYNYMYVNGIRKDEIPAMNRDGATAHARWIAKDLKGEALGSELFRAQCMSCHNKQGYRGMDKLLGERDVAAIRGLLQVMRETDPAKSPYVKIMPPLAGTDAEVDALAAYLSTLNAANRKNEPQLAQR
ncbi:MAG: cytochrome ubiquinol oxidase subunit I [Vampirovibrionales bacterium]|nr:cytochrome ubiquinol oxidase subunit I [Vampirovibrionales bacterium]